MDTVFYTDIAFPRDATYGAIMDLTEKLRALRSVTFVKIMKDTDSIRVVVGGRWASTRFSDCPLPGTHEFAAGWLAHEAMMAVSGLFGQPTAWVEGEVRKEELRLPGHDPIIYPATRYHRDRPPVMIDYRGFLADTGSLNEQEPPSPLSQSGQITGPGQP